MNNTKTIANAGIDSMSRDNVEHNESLKFSDVETVLANEFGDRFREYRKLYKKSLNYDKNGYIPEFPLTVQIELVNRCNLTCIMCYQSNHHDPKATLSVDTICRLMEEGKKFDLPAVVVGMGSEALLFKEIKAALKVIRDADVMDIFLGTNGTLLNESICEALVEMRIARVEISLDAATRETYKAIRGKDQLDVVERNIRTLLEVKKRRNSKLPIVRLCFCAQEKNIHEAEDFIRKWDGVVDYVDFQQMADYSQVDSLRQTGLPSDPERILSAKVESTYCEYPFNDLHVWSNGDVSPCGFFGKSGVLNVGNIHKNTLKEIWDGDKLAKIRKQLLTGKLNPTCQTCLSGRNKDYFAQAKAVSEKFKGKKNA